MSENEEGYEAETSDDSLLRKRIGSHMDEIIKQLDWDYLIRDASYNIFNLLGEKFLRRESLTYKSGIATAAAIVSWGARYAGVDQKKGEKGPVDRIANCDLCKSVNTYTQVIWTKQRKIRESLVMRI